MFAPTSLAFETVPEPFFPAEETDRPVEIPAPTLRRWSTTHRPSPPRRPLRVLPAAPTLYRWLGERFSPGEATVWLGPRDAIEPLLEAVYVGCGLARGRVSLIEGANRFHPYRVGERGRAAGVDPAELLGRIRLARAFTAYQLVALVDAWSTEARRHRPTLLVAHELPELFFTEEVPEEERRPLLEHVARALKEVVRSTGHPLLVTASLGWERFPGLGSDGPPLFDLVKLRPSSRALVLEGYRDGHRLTVVPRRFGQHGLEEFAPEEPRQEVTSWVAPYRPTARRSKSG